MASPHVKRASFYIFEAEDTPSPPSTPSRKRSYEEFSADPFSATATSSAMMSHGYNNFMTQLITSHTTYHCRQVLASSDSSYISTEGLPFHELGSVRSISPVPTEIDPLSDWVAPTSPEEIHRLLLSEGIKVRDYAPPPRVLKLEPTEIATTESQTSLSNLDTSSGASADRDGQEGEGQRLWGLLKNKLGRLSWIRQSVGQVLFQEATAPQASGPRAEEVSQGREQSTERAGHSTNMSETVEADPLPKAKRQRMSLGGKQKKMRKPLGRTETCAQIVVSH
ncbi:hypothetical protein EVG20_g11680 [Dentipellis fragilis]|uniref:Uncharacterized protein n=1 Tax=Dentipellis fragilis TaxID=205917 RepID=A0A4Y9XKH5_9AGAM|nr:hypothetical protein EVG20_g11680 [Dentipellis fragilis]